MFRSLFLLLLASTSVSSQSVNITPDCTIGFTFTAVGTSPPTTVPAQGFDNRQAGCQVWAMTYSVSGFSSTANISLQSALNVNGIPSTFGTFSGQTIVQGSNPNTNTSTGTFVLLTGYQPWVRVSLNSVGSGSGVVTGVAFGWRSLAGATHAP